MPRNGIQPETVVGSAPPSSLSAGNKNSAPKRDAHKYNREGRQFAHGDADEKERATPQHREQDQQQPGLAVDGHGSD